MRKSVPPHWASNPAVPVTPPDCFHPFTAPCHRYDLLDRRKLERDEGDDGESDEGEDQDQEAEEWLDGIGGDARVHEGAAAFYLSTREVERHCVVGAYWWSNPVLQGLGGSGYFAKVLRRRNKLTCIVHSHDSACTES